MKKNKNRLIVKWIAMWSALALAGVLFVFTLTNSPTISEVFTNGFIRSEIMYIIFVFLLILPVLLLALLILIIIRSKRDTEIEVDSIETTSETATVTTQGDTTASSSTGTGEAMPSGDGVSRFCILCRMDENKSQYEQAEYDETVTLKKFCDSLRNYAASELKLYYDISDIRRFIAGLAVSPIIILQGMSGTGKTSLAHAMGAFLDNPSTVIPVQPMWKERTDLLGYYNEFTKRFNETLLLEKMYEANYSSAIYITVLDEMNIARVEYYFAEFLSLLELPNPKERYIDVVSDMWDNDPIQLRDGRLMLPDNMWFVGTANNDDSTFAISDKVYDRAMILNLDTKAERFVAPRTKPIRLSSKRFKELAREATREYEITKRNMKRLEELDKYLIKHFHITFGNRIMKQICQYIPVYVSCGGEEIEALDDILSKKIIRKLETQNPVYLRKEVDRLCNYLDELFGTDKMPLCKEAIHRLERNA